MLFSHNVRFSFAESDDGSDVDGQEKLELDTSAPEFYDPEADLKNEKWVAKLRRGQQSDAILSCPLCFTTVCIDCQQHATNEHQFRAMFVMNCKVDTQQIVKPAPEAASKQQRKRRQRQQLPPKTDKNCSNDENAASKELELEQYNPVHCASCDNELGLRELGPSGAYHLFHVLASK